MSDLKVLVLGDGLLGSEIIKQSNWDYISRKKDGFRVLDPSSWDFTGYDVVVNCIAHTDTYSKGRELHWKVNYQFVYDLILYCNQHNIKLVHISTEYLYTGSISHATEDDVPVHFDNWYCYTKLLGDGLVQLVSNDYLICRCMHKPNPLPFKKSWVDQVGNFDYVENIAPLIIKLISKGCNGVYNVGTELKTMIDLAKRSSPMVEADFSPSYVPKDVSMSIKKLNESLMINYEIITKCPITGSDDKLMYFDLGNFPLVNNLNNSREESINCERYPLNINLFNESKLTLLSCVVDGKKLFSNYLFKSEVNRPYIQHCKVMFEYINSIVKINDNDLIIDIGGNDGTLLDAFKSVSQNKLDLLNIDPSTNLRELSLSKGITTLTEFFSYDVSLSIKKKAKVIVSTNVFQHLKDINSFVNGVYHLLDENGVWILEFPYWIHDLETFQFDQIYHEHVYYYSLTPLNLMMKKHHLKIIKVQDQKIHGGTVRLSITKDSSELPSDDSLEKYLDKESKYDIEYYKNWGLKIKNNLENYKKIILDLKSNGKKIAGFGAAAKGCIFLNSIGLTYNEIDFIVDDTDIKQGKFMPGTGIEIVSRDYLKNNQVDYLIILTHNFADYIMESLSDFNGRFITFLPEFKIY
jgi:dTDP-4-dehydrorhamnose reductase